MNWLYHTWPTRQMDSTAWRAVLNPTPARPGLSLGLSDPRETLLPCYPEREWTRSGEATKQAKSKTLNTSCNDELSLPLDIKIMNRPIDTLPLRMAPVFSSTASAQEIAPWIESTSSTLYCAVPYVLAGDRSMLMSRDKNGRFDAHHTHTHTHVWSRNHVDDGAWFIGAVARSHGKCSRECGPVARWKSGQKATTEGRR